MDCAEFEALLFQDLDAERASSDVERLREHLLTCANCRHLDSLVRGDDQRSVTELPPDFAADVVARTSGEPCERAQLVLAASDENPSDDGWLVAQHLEHCPQCSAVARTVTRLRVDLPMLAEADPGQGFVVSVIAATSGVRRERGTSHRAGRQDFIERLIRRPRIALEGAYALVMVLLIVFGLTSLSLTDLPLRAGGEAWRSAAAVMQIVAASVTELKTGALVRADRMAKSVSADARELGSSVSVAAREFAGQAWDGLVTEHVREIRSLWNEKLSKSVEHDTSN